VPDPLPTIEPVASLAGPALKNEMMLPAVLDPWAGHARYKAYRIDPRPFGHEPGSGEPRGVSVVERGNPGFRRGEGFDLR
jgi:hypothetical protein